MMSKAADLFVSAMNSAQAVNAAAGGMGGGIGLPSAIITGGMGGGIGLPSAIITGGMGGGIGLPSAIITGGMGGGIGLPSAIIVAANGGVKLTIALTGATINTARTKSARDSLFLFTLEPPRLTMNGNKEVQHCRSKKFCLRNSAGPLWKHSHNSNRIAVSFRISP
jgi:hypothetical protein